jgi:hypothetical protein
MAHLFANFAAVPPGQEPLLAGLQRLPDTFWVFGPVSLWRHVDWLVLRTGARPHVFVISVTPTSQTMRGFQQSVWERQRPDGSWQTVATGLAEDVNPLGQATNTAETARTYLRERSHLLEGGRIMPLLLVLSATPLLHQLPQTPIDGWGLVLFSPQACIDQLRTFEPGPVERIPVARADAERILAILRVPNSLAPKPTGRAAPPRPRSGPRISLPGTSALVKGALVLALVAAVGIAATWGRPYVEPLVGQAGSGLPPQLRSVPALVNDLMEHARALAGLPSAQPVEPPALGHAFCDPGKQPAFQLGFASLKSALGDPMGEPTECEHTDDVTGDIQQHTSTGLAYYRPSLNLAMFTNGAEHWALTPAGLVRWTDGNVTPPDDATVVSR